MFLLPSHMSHLTQPLDKGCFGPYARVLGVSNLSSMSGRDQASVLGHFSKGMVEVNDDDKHHFWVPGGRYLLPESPGSGWERQDNMRVFGRENGVGVYPTVQSLPSKEADRQTRNDIQPKRDGSLPNKI